MDDDRWQALREGRIRPTKDDLRAAAGRVVPDVIAPGLTYLFCGINPGLYTAAVGHHFARPGNRFWPALYRAGLTDRLYSPYEEEQLLALRIGITNIVPRATGGASELTREEVRAGAVTLRDKVTRLQPCVLAILGLGAYRTAFGGPRAALGLQSERMGETSVWVLPNPSGANAYYQPAVLVELLAEMRESTERGTCARLTGAE